MTGRPVALAPAGRLAETLAAAVEAGGGSPVEEVADAEALVWCDWRPGGLAEVLAEAPGLEWVQLPYAGIEAFSSLLDEKRTWTCAKGIYGSSVAEFALGLMLAGLRRIDRYARASEWSPLPQRTLEGSTVAILGAGGIGLALARMLQPIGAKVSLVSRSGARVEEFDTLPESATAEAVATADVVVLALPLTPATTGLVDRRFLAAMREDAWLVNVARGGVVVTDDLVEALEEASIGGAALDVTDPEPLPAGHRLFQLENAIVTPHVANTSETGTADLSRLVTENTRRFLAGETLLGLVDPRLGY